MTPRTGTGASPPTRRDPADDAWKRGNLPGIRARTIRDDSPEEATSSAPRPDELTAAPCRPHRECWTEWWSRPREDREPSAVLDQCEACPIRCGPGPVQEIQPVEAPMTTSIPDRGEATPVTPPVEVAPPRPGFARDYVRAALASDLPANGKLVAVALASNFADPDGANCFPGAASVSEAVGGLTTVRRWIGRLHRDGWLDAVPFVTGEGQVNSLYVLRIPAGARGDSEVGAVSWSKRKVGRPAAEDSPLWERAHCSDDTRARVQGDQA